MSKKKEEHDEVFKRPEECFSGKAKVVVFPPDFLQNFGFLAPGHTVESATKNLVNKTTSMEARNSVHQIGLKKSPQLKYPLKQKTNTTKQKKEKSHLKKVSEAQQDNTIKSEVKRKKDTTDKDLGEAVNSVNDCSAPRNSLKENADDFPVLRRALSKKDVECSLVSKKKDKLHCKHITESQESSILETCCLLKESVALSPSFTDTFIPNVNVSKRYNEQTNISNVSAFQHTKIDENEHFKPVLIQIPAYEINNENETFLLQPLSRARDSNKNVTQTAINFNPANIFMVNKYETVIASSPVEVTSHVNNSFTTTLQSQHASQVIECPKVTNIAQEKYLIGMCYSKLDEVTANHVDFTPVVGTCIEEAHLSNSINDNCIDVPDLENISKVSILKTEIIKPALSTTTTSTVISNSSAEPVIVSTTESPVETNKELSVLESVNKICVTKPKHTHIYKNKTQKCKNSMSLFLPKVHETINSIDPKSYVVTSKESLNESGTTNSGNVSLEINTDMLQEKSTLQSVGICGKVIATYAKSTSEDVNVCKVITDKENKEWILKSQQSNETLKSHQMKDLTKPEFKTIGHPSRSFSKNNEHFLPEEVDWFEESETLHNSSKEVVDIFTNKFQNRARESSNGSRLQYQKKNLMKTYERKRKFVNCSASSTQGVEKPGGIVSCDTKISEVKNKIVTYSRRKNAALKSTSLQNVKNEPHLQLAHGGTSELDPSKLIIDCEITSDTHTIDFQMFNVGSKFSMNFEPKDTEVNMNLVLDNQTNAALCNPGNVTHDYDSGMIFSGCNENYLEEVICDTIMSNYSMPIIENELEKLCGSETIFNVEENVELFQNILSNKSTELMVSRLLTEDLLAPGDCYHTEDVQPSDLISEQCLNFDKIDAFKDDQGAFDIFETIASNGDDANNIGNIDKIGYSAVTPLDNMEISNENVENDNEHIYNFSAAQMLPNKIDSVLERSKSKNVFEKYFENNNKTEIGSSFKVKDLGNCGSDNLVSSFIKSNKVSQEESDNITTKNETLACRTAETKHHTQLKSTLVSREDNAVIGSPLSRYNGIHSANNLSKNLTEIADETLATTIRTADTRKVNEEVDHVRTLRNDKIKKRKCRPPKRKQILEVNIPVNVIEDNTVTNSRAVRCTRRQRGDFSITLNATETVGGSITKHLAEESSRQGIEEEDNMTPTKRKRQRGRPPKPKHPEYLDGTRRQRGDFSITLNATETVGDSITERLAEESSPQRIQEEDNMTPTQRKRQRGRPPKPRHPEYLDVQRECSQGSSLLTESSTNTITELKVLKCGVCIKEIIKDKWMLHCAKEHNYLAWRDGDTPINFADDDAVIQHLHGIAKCCSHFECAVCANKLTSPQKFWHHVRQCTDEDQNDISHEGETQNEPVNKATGHQNSLQNGEAAAEEINRYNNDEVLKEESIESIVTCGVCQWRGDKTDWFNHIFREHEYLAWTDGEQSLDINNDALVHDHLKLILKKLSKLKCRKCGIERKYVRGFLKHCRSCGGSEQPECGIAPRQRRSHEGDTLHPDATRAASEESVQNKSTTGRRISVYSDSDDISLKKLKEERVKCGRCHEEVNSLTWLDHLLEHNYLAWQEGDTPVNVECAWSATAQLRAMLDRHGVLTCRLCRSTLTTVPGYQYHIRRCEEKSQLVPSPAVQLKRRYVRKSDIVTPTSQHPTTDPVRCGVCSEVMPNNKWRSHLEKVHYNLAWFDGGVPFDITDYHTCYIILNDLIKKQKKLVCVKCGETRMSGAGFYSHIIVCGKTEEEIEAMKVSCPMCERKVLPLSMAQHMLTHRASAGPASPPPDVAAHAETGGRRRAALAAKASIEKITSVLVQSKRSCSKCNYVAYTDEELKKHRCGSDNIKDEDFSSGEVTDNECRWESESEDSDSAVDSNLSAQESNRVFSEEEYDSRPGSSTDKKKDKSIDRYAYRPGEENELLNGPSFRKFIEDFCATHFTTGSLYPELRCNKFEAVPEHEVERYRPPLPRSCFMFRQTSQMQTAEWKSYGLFHSEFESGAHTLFVGGAVAGFSFVPPADRMSREPAEHYISVTCQPDASVDGLMHNELHSHPGLIQIWNFGNFEREERARFVLGLAHDYGTVWALDWCPSGALEPPAGAAGCVSELRRLGLMAAACSNGSVYIFAVCHPEQLTESETSMYRTRPVLELQLCSDGQRRSNYQATAVHWSMQKGHSIVSVGYSDGVVALYDLSTTSPILRRIKDDVPILNPFFDSQLMDSAVTPSLLQHCLPAHGLVSALDSAALHPPDHDAISSGGSWERAHATEEVPRAACLHSRRVAVATLAHQLLLLRFYPNSDLVKRNILATFQMTPLEDNKYAKEKTNEDLEVVIEPNTYEEAVKQYGIKWTSYRRWVEVHKPDLYPLASVTAIAFCPCRCHFTRLAWGNLAGLVHIITL